MMISFKFIATSSIKGVATQLASPITFITPLQVSQQINYGRSISSSNNLHASALKPHKLRTAIMEAEINLPPKPKKPITPWLAFVRDRKDEVLRQHGTLPANKLTQILSKEWKDLDKTDYVREFEIRQENYYAKVEDYKNSLTDAQREYLNLRRDYLREDKANQVIRRSKPPKLPRNIPNMYIYDRCQEPHIKDQMKDRKASEVFSDLFKEYRELSEEQKQKYVNLQEDDKIRFQQEFMQWYDSIKSDKTLGKAVIEQANIMYERYKALSYI